MSKHWIVAAAVFALSPLAVAQHGGHEGHGQHSAPAASDAKAKPATPVHDPKFKGRVVELTVTEDGFVPATVQVKKGEPLKLVVTRKTDLTCAKDLVIDEANVKQTLPLNEAVAIVFTPKKSGEIRYGCSMGKMVGGVLSVQ